MGNQRFWKNLAGSGALAGILVWAFSAAAIARVAPARPWHPVEMEAAAPARDVAAATDEDPIDRVRAEVLRRRAEAARQAAVMRAAEAKRHEQARSREQAGREERVAARDRSRERDGEGARKAAARQAALRKAQADQERKRTTRKRTARVASRKEGAATVSLADVELLARVIKIEAGGEPYEGKVAVGAVIVNRVRSPRFPNSLRAVIYSPGQFPGVTEMIDEVRPGSSDLRAAKEALAGRDPSNGALYFYNPRIHRCDGEGDFLCSLKVTARIGNHVFAR
ncbi:MAG: cell wall hydrolase [Bacillota bacterium]|nr:MAG: cell wall hydrolase [Bacillota bacterium]